MGKNENSNAIKKNSIYSLATTYPESLQSTKAKFVHILNRELAKLGCDVIAIVPHRKGILTKQMIDSVKVHHFRYLPEKYELDALSIPDEIRNSKFGLIKVSIMIFFLFMYTFSFCLKSKPDIFHGHWAFPGGLIAVLLAKIFHKKSVVTSYYAEIPLVKKNWLIKKTVAYWLNRASRVIAISTFTKEELVGIGIREEKISIIKPCPNFMNHTSDTKFLNKFRNKIARPDEKLVLFCGRLVENKGVEFLIRSFTKIENQNIKLVIVGNGTLLKELQELTKSLSLENKVTFYGRTSDDELGLLHDVCDVLVCPSIVDSRGITEGLGLVIPEAMESGLPVIATSVGGVVDIVKHEVNGLLIEPKDPMAIAMAIERIFSDGNLTKNLIINSKQTVKVFQPKKIASEYLKIFFDKQDR